jgi:uncharacterized 2Fe-2S/4Fe-4S cluster protein (DUF4445 family)
MPASLEAEGYVLVCRARLLDEPVTVELLSRLDDEKGQFSVAAEDMLLIDPEFIPVKEDTDCLVKKALIHVPQSAMGDGLSDYDRLKKNVETEIGGRCMDLPLSVLRKLPLSLRENNGEATLSYYINSGFIYPVDVEPSNTIGENFGIALDIGTTTIAVKLVNMTDGRIIAYKTAYNAQIECGLDIISRINYARKPEGLKELKNKVLDTINPIIRELADTAGINTSSVYNAAIAGNTTMIHLLLGIVPEYIRLEPYTPAIYRFPYFKASEIGIAVNPAAHAFISPCVGSYVGGDIVSGLLCTDLSTGRKRAGQENSGDEVSLFIDIGTNGEIVLGNDDFMICCACSAGPAFEGGGIENGMRASMGAVENVEIDAATGTPKYNVIGNLPPGGICGTGMISLVSGLFETGWMDSAGRLDRTGRCPAITVEGRNAFYTIAGPTETSSGNPLYVTENDVSNIIRAKAAIFSACSTLLAGIGMEFEQLSRVYIAGGFGRYLDIDKAKTIGLIPDIPKDKFRYIGNSSLSGAYMALISKKHRERQLELADRMTYIDLSSEPGYMDQYTAALFLPHTDSSLFPTSRSR